MHGEYIPGEVKAASIIEEIHYELLFITFSESIFYLYNLKSKLNNCYIYTQHTV